MKTSEIFRDDNDVDDNLSWGEILQQLISTMEKMEAEARLLIKHYLSQHDLENRTVSIVKKDATIGKSSGKEYSSDNNRHGAECLLSASRF